MSTQSLLKSQGFNMDEFTACPIDYIDPIIRVDNEGYYVAYAVYDDDPEEPSHYGIFVDRRHTHPDKVTAELEGVPDHFRVALDVYAHSGEWWSLHGEGTQCRWDTSRQAVIWYAPKARQQDMIAAVKKNHLTANDTDEEGNVIMFDEDNITDELYALSVKYCRQDLEVHNAYNGGDVYGIIIDHFDKDRNFIDQADACYGYIGTRNTLIAMQNELTLGVVYEVD